jgi:hypothetical protein
MSKLKMLEIVAVTSPKKLVPGALLGLLESMGMMRCGNLKIPFKFVGYLAGRGHPEKQPSALRVISPQFVPPGVW